MEYYFCLHFILWIIFGISSWKLLSLSCCQRNTKLNGHLLILYRWKIVVEFVNLKYFFKVYHENHCNSNDRRSASVGSQIVGRNPNVIKTFYAWISGTIKSFYDIKNHFIEENRDEHSLVFIFFCYIWKIWKDIVNIFYKTLELIDLKNKI